MATYKISCTIGTTDPAAKLGLELWLDNQQLINIDHVSQESALSFDIDDDEAEHELRFIMKNKTPSDTTVDAAGNIIKDATLTINDVAIDEIKLEQVFLENTVYTHNFNGSKPEIKDVFYGQMGCNGVLSFTYSTPFYLWLLENM